MTTEYSVNRLKEAACDLLESARTIEAAAGEPGGSDALPATLGALEETLRVLSASVYRLAADAAPGLVARRDREPLSAQERARPPGGPEHEREREPMATLHDAGCGLARAARACRDAREGLAPVLGRDHVPREELVGAARAHDVGFVTAATPRPGGRGDERAPRRNGAERPPRARGRLVTSDLTPHEKRRP